MLYKISDFFTFVRVVTFVLCFLLFDVNVSASQDLLVCRARVDYIGDTNIEGTTSADSRGYFKPRLRVRLFPFSDLPFYLQSEIIYDHYIRERDFDDNSPFISADIGFRPRGNKSRLYSEISYKHYMGYVLEENEQENWRPVLKEFEFNNKIRMRVMRSNVDFILNARFNHFSSLYDNEPWEELGPSLETGAEITYLRIRCKKSKSFCLENIQSSFFYEYCGFEKIRRSYNMFTFGSGLNLKVLRTSINTFAKYSRKIYMQERDNDSVGTVVPYYNRYDCGVLVTVPVIEYLDFRLGAKLRFRDSNWPNFDYDRHTFFIGLEWNSSIGR